MVLSSHKTLCNGNGMAVQFLKHSKTGWPLTFQICTGDRIKAVFRSYLNTGQVGQVLEQFKF
jgi:hypothetical protein